MKPKDWATIMISGTALIVAIATAYFTLIKQEDELTANLDGKLDLRADDSDPGGPRIEAFSNQKLTITNSGNRTASIRGIWLRIASPPDDELCMSRSERHNFEFIPVLLKPGDVWVGELRFIQIIGSDEVFNRDFYDVRYNKNDNPIRVSACLGFDIVTPGDSPQEFVQLLLKGELPRQSYVFFRGDEQYKEGTPISILKKKRHKFW